MEGPLCFLSGFIPGVLPGKGAFSLHGKGVDIFLISYGYIWLIIYGQVHSGFLPASNGRHKVLDGKVGTLLHNGTYYGTVSTLDASKHPIDTDVRLSLFRGDITVILSLPEELAVFFTALEILSLIYGKGSFPKLTHGHVKGIDILLYHMKDSGRFDGFQSLAYCHVHISHVADAFRIDGYPVVGKNPYGLGILRGNLEAQVG